MCKKEQDQLEQKTDIDLSSLASGTYWDPIQGRLSTESIQACQKEDSKILQKFNYYKEHPNVIKRNTFLLAFLTIGLWVCFWFNNIRPYENEPMFYLFLLALIPFSLYYSFVVRMQKELAELMVSSRFSWLYYPTTDIEKWTFLKNAYPEIFQKGNSAQSVYDQFWGSINNQLFWLSCFQYTVGSGKNSHTVVETVYAFPLSSKVAATFLLEPQNAWNKFESTIRHSLTTESNDFNRNFHIEYKGDTGLVGADILEVLTPTAQEKLLDFHKVCKNFTLLFRENTMLVSFSGDLEIKHTNFLRKVELDQRDADDLTSKLTRTVELAEAVLPCIS